MKNNISKYLIAVFFFCSTLTVFAQVPGQDTAELEEDLENDGSNDTDGAPIDDYVWVLAAIGLVYVWKLRAFAPQEKATQE